MNKAILVWALVSLSMALFFSCNDEDETPPDESLPPVEADFSANQTNIQEGQSVTFSDQSTGEPTAWDWSFEGVEPTTSSERNPTVTYQTAGTYTVTLIASNQENSNTETKTDYITVFAEVSADFSASDSVVAVGQNVTFTDQSVGEPTTWNWGFAGAEPATSTEQNPTVSYPAVGTYDISLTALNGTSEATEHKTDLIRVFEIITAEFSADTTSLVEGEMVQFTDVSVGSPTQWEWSFPGGTPASSTEQNPIITYVTPGTFAVTLTARSNDTTATVTKTDYITVEEAEMFVAPTEGLEFWLRADTAVTVDAQNRVENWGDVSGNDYAATQTEIVRKPLLVEDGLQGHPVIRFDGQDDVLSLGNILNEVFAGPDQEFTVFVVLKITDGRFGSVLAKIADSGFAPLRNERQFALSVFENRVYHLTYYSLSDPPLRARGIASVSEVVDTAHVITYAYDGAQDGSNGLARVNLLIDGKETEKTLQVSPGALGDIPEGPARLAIGNFVSEDGAVRQSNSLAGDIAEMLLYSQLPTDAKREAIEGYLGAKYGITTP